MSRLAQTLLPLFCLSVLAGCTGKPAAIALASPAPVAAPVVPAAIPAGAYPGMTTPRLADGSYATPNRDLAPDATVWHLRAALNVAALACRGEDEPAIVAGYNALLTRAKAPLALAEARYAAQYQAAGGAWRDRYDDAMTRLYNFFSQAPARAGFCRAAAATLADSVYVGPADLPAFAAGRLAVLERPFTDFYRAYDAWRDQAGSRPMTAPASAIVMASAAPVQPRSLTVTVPAARPRLELDPSVFRDTALAH